MLILNSPGETLAQWATMADDDQLENKAVVDAGEVSLRTTSKPTYDPFLEMETYHSVEFLEFYGSVRICIPPETFLGLIFQEAALLLVDENDLYYLAVIEPDAGNDIDVTVERVNEIQCPSY